MMRAGELIRDLPVAGAADPDLEIVGITHDSRRVRPGDLFVALLGDRFDGRTFACEAVDRGAVAVLGPGQAPQGFGGVWLEAREPRRLLGPLAARIFGHPDRQLVTVGVTGTNGKSTVVSLVAAMLEAGGLPAGRIGTLGYRFQDLGFEGGRTTPEASDLFRTLRQMRDAGASAVAVEVSSHGMCLGRVDGAAFDVAVFLNLTRDHFDFHRGFEDYFAAKRRLFAKLKAGGRGVVNVGDRYGAQLARELARPLTFGPGGEVSPVDVELDEQGMRGRVHTPRGDLRFTSPLLGEFNLDNVVAAVAAAEALDLPHPAVAEALASVRPLPGRMEPVNAGQPFPAFIDYAHTDAALGAALRSLRGFCNRPIVLVFGCGGDRDPGKRVLMGRVAGELAAIPIVTSDNPRSEEPAGIIAMVEKGLRESGSSSFHVVEDRRDAIRRAVELAAEGSALLVAGKGHERTQIVGNREVHFDDREELTRALEERFG
jgi:UDP-N-acetylmuramoyl-L-alanyl-D-glutamate--2,6-diaminopimelate ligase